MLLPHKTLLTNRIKEVKESGMRIYIGSAIDTSLGSPEEQFKELSNLVATTLGDSVVIYNPLTAFGNAHKITEQEDLEFVVKMNTSAVERCQAGVFVWTDSPSYGVPLEIENFSSSMKPFIVWNKGSKKPGLYLRYAMGKYGLGRVTSSEEETAEALKTLIGLVDATQYMEKGQ